MLFKAGFGLEYQQGIMLALTCAALYTLIGGFIAVAWCDFFQGMFLLAMIVLVPAAAYLKLGSWSIITEHSMKKVFPLVLHPHGRYL